MTEDSSVARLTTGRNDCATLHNHSLDASLTPSLRPAKGPSVTNSPTSSSYNRPYPTLSTPTLMPAAALPSITTPTPTIRPHNTTSLRPTASPTYLTIGTQPPTASQNNITLVVPQETLLVLLEGLSLSLTAYQTEAFANVSLQFIRKHLPIAVNSISIRILTIDRFEVEGQQLLMLDRNNTEALIQVSKPSIRRFLFDEIPALSIRCQVGGSQLALATNARNTTGDDYVNAIATFLILNYQSYLSVLSKDPALEQLWSQSTPTTLPGNDSNNNGLNHPSSDSSRTPRRSTNWNLVGSTLGLSVVAVCALWLVRRLRRLRDQRVQQQSSIMADIHQDHIRERNNEEKVTTLVSTVIARLPVLYPFPSHSHNIVISCCHS